MAITTLIAACAILGSVSASAKHVKKDDVLTADIKTNATELTPQTINVPFDQQESPILLIYDNEFIIKVIPQERPSNGSNLLEIYRIGDNQPIYSAIPYGREEGRLYSAIPFIQGNTLLLQDGVNEVVARVDLKSAVNDSSYTPEITKCEILINYMIPYKDGIAYLSPYWTSDERITQKDKGDKFLFAGKELKKDSFTGKYQTTSITSGSLVANRLGGTSTRAEDSDLGGQNILNYLKFIKRFKKNSLGLDIFTQYSKQTEDLLISSPDEQQSAVQRIDGRYFFNTIKYNYSYSHGEWLKISSTTSLDYLNRHFSSDLSGVRIEDNMKNDVKLQYLRPYETLFATFTVKRFNAFVGIDLVPVP